MSISSAGGSVRLGCRTSVAFNWTSSSEWDLRVKDEAASEEAFVLLLNMGVV